MPTGRRTAPSSGSRRCRSCSERRRLALRARVAGSNRPWGDSPGPGDSMSRVFLSDFGPPHGEGRKRRATDGLARHGVAGPVGQVPNGARYGRILGEPDRQEWDVAELEELANALAELGGKSTDNFDIPSGYTYFGQFVDHDLTFDPTSRLRRGNDPDALVDYRSPALDLDSLYGSGPMDQPYMYDWNAEPAGVKLLLDACDLPRNSQGRALIGDPRND